MKINQIKENVLQLNFFKVPYKNNKKDEETNEMNTEGKKLIKRDTKKII